MSDIWSNPEVERWMNDALVNMIPKLKSSQLALSIFPRDGEGDIKYYLELGAAIMLGKPLIVIAEPGQSLPPKLEAVADEIVRVTWPLGDADDNPELFAAITRVVGKGRET